MKDESLAAKDRTLLTRISEATLGSEGLSGKTSKMPRPRISSRFVIVACKYASFTEPVLGNSFGRDWVRANSKRLRSWPITACADACLSL